MTVNKMIIAGKGAQGDVNDANHKIVHVYFPAFLYERSRIFCTFAGGKPAIKREKSRMLIGLFRVKAGSNDVQTKKRSYNENKESAFGYGHGISATDGGAAKRIARW